MIIDSIDRVDWYLSINSRIAQAFRFLQKADLEALAPGTYQIDAKRIYANVQEYETRAESSARYECHHRHIDIHYMVSGSERIGWANRNRMVRGTYDEEKDLEFHDSSGVLIEVQAGCFMLLTPHDAHLPCVQPASGRNRVKKVVVKVLRAG